MPLGLGMAKQHKPWQLFYPWHFDLYFHRFGELYPKRIALNLKDALAIRTAPVIIGIGKLVSPFVWLLAASTNFLSHLTPMSFDDADEKDDP